MFACACASGAVIAVCSTAFENTGRQSAFSRQARPAGNVSPLSPSAGKNQP